MPPCCPPHHGCNARAGEERCALEVLDGLPGEDARRALALWSALCTHPRARRRRFLARSYARIRDRALAAGSLAEPSALHRV